MVIAEIPDLSIHMSDVADRVGEVGDRLRDLSETATKTAADTASRTAQNASKAASKRAQRASRTASKRARGASRTASRTAQNVSKKAQVASKQARGQVGRSGRRSLAGPLAATGLGIVLLALFLVFRSRRSTSNVGSANPSEAYAHI